MTLESRRQRVGNTPGARPGAVRGRSRAATSPRSGKTFEMKGFLEVNGGGSERALRRCTPPVFPSFRGIGPPARPLFAIGSSLYYEGMSERTNHPVKALGPVPIRRTPILQAQERLAREIDLSAMPPLISGGDRKARGKAVAEQRSSQHVPRRLDRLYRLRPNPAYGSLAITCGHCRHGMLLDELDADPSEIICDRCRRPV